MNRHMNTYIKCCFRQHRTEKSHNLRAEFKADVPLTVHALHGRENSSATWLARNISRQPPSTCVLRWNIPTFDCWKIAIRNWASIRRCCYKCVEGIMGHWGYYASFVFWHNKFQHRQAGQSMCVNWTRFGTDLLFLACRYQLLEIMIGAVFVSCMTLFWAKGFNLQMILGSLGVSGSEELWWLVDRWIGQWSPFW